MVNLVVAKRLGAAGYRVFLILLQILSSQAELNLFKQEIRLIYCSFIIKVLLMLSTKLVSEFDLTLKVFHSMLVVFTILLRVELLNAVNNSSSACCIKEFQYILKLVIFKQSMNNSLLSLI